MIGSFYEIDSGLNITKLADVMPEPGHRYALLYGLADPTFDKSVAEFSRFSDAGKLMALASFSNRRKPSDEEERIIAFLMQDCLHLKPKECEMLRHCRHYNVGLDDQEFRNFAGIVSDRIFDRFFQFAESNMKRRMPLLITGGCGLNCDWNTKWREANLFPEVFVPPVANDSGSAIGTAIDAQFHFTGNPKIKWNVYSGLKFIANDAFDASLFDEYKTNYAMIADMLASNLLLLRLFQLAPICCGLEMLLMVGGRGLHGSGGPAWAGAQCRGRAGFETPPWAGAGDCDERRTRRGRRAVGDG